MLVSRRVVDNVTINQYPSKYTSPMDPSWGLWVGAEDSRSNEKSPGCLGFVGIIIKHYKDPY